MQGATSRIVVLSLQCFCYRQRYSSRSCLTIVQLRSRMGLTKLEVIVPRLGRLSRRANETMLFAEWYRLAGGLRHDFLMQVFYLLL